MVIESLKATDITTDARSIKHVGIIVFEGVVLADVLGVADVFVVGDKLIASVFPGSIGYTISLLSITGGSIRSSASVQIMTAPLPPHDTHAFDTLLIVSGTGNFSAYNDPNLIDWLQNASRTVRRIAGICTGVFVMGAAGLLDNRYATTHWALQDKLLSDFPKVRVDRQAVITEDGTIFTVSEVGMAAELALRFLEADMGSAIAKRVEESLLGNKRMRRDNPPSCRPSKQNEAAASNRVQQASRWFEEHMAEPINMISAANFVAMSERNFQRQFKRETGWTPHEYLLHIRLQAVRQQLAETDLPVARSPGDAVS
jgi:transcriptional regulator GlxA family with amidase domain